MTEHPAQHFAATESETAEFAPSTSGDDAGIKEQAAASAEAGKQAAADVAQTATDKAKDVAQEAGQQARNLISDAQSQLQDHARDQHKSAVSNLRALGDELNSMSERSEHSGPATDLVAQAGSRVTSAASWLDDREPGDLVNEVRRFARQRPGVFLIGALAAGVLAGRLTRGVVAVHKDSGDEVADPSAPASVIPAQPIVPAAAPTSPGFSTVPGPDRTGTGAGANGDAAFGAAPTAPTGPVQVHP